MNNIFFFLNFSCWWWWSENHDGKVSKEEYFAIDKDNNGFIDRNELMEFMSQELGFHICKDETNFAEAVLRMGGDANKDGKLTWTELQRMHGNADK